jgi:hypothetical protein
VQMVLFLLFLFLFLLFAFVRQGTAGYLQLDVFSSMLGNSAVSS